MRDIFYKSYSFDFEGRTGFACFGFAIEYNENVPVNILTTENFYYNIKDPETSNLVAALDILNLLEEQRFYSANEEIRMINFAPSISNFYSNQKRMLLNEEQLSNISVLDHKIKSLKASYGLIFSSTDVIKDKNSFDGYQRLQVQELGVIEYINQVLQSKIDYEEAASFAKEQRRSLAESRVKYLDQAIEQFHNHNEVLPFNSYEDIVTQKEIDLYKARHKLMQIKDKKDFYTNRRPFYLKAQKYF